MALGLCVYWEGSGLMLVSQRVESGQSLYHMVLKTKSLPVWKHLQETTVVLFQY